MPHLLDKVVGLRRPLGIGISPEEYRQSLVSKPSEDVLARYSSNPRNAAGRWYEDHIDQALEPICVRLGILKVSKGERRLSGSRVYLTDKVVDIVLKKESGSKPGREFLGLELKFLGGEGSLVAPKAVVDALDFTNRPYHCLYVIDGEGWLGGGKTSFVDFLATWWEFTNTANLERTLSTFFG